jgi:hypothetical protein
MSIDQLEQLLATSLHENDIQSVDVPAAAPSSGSASSRTSAPVAGGLSSPSLPPSSPSS